MYTFYYISVLVMAGSLIVAPEKSGTEEDNLEKMLRQLGSRRYSEQKIAMESILVRRHRSIAVLIRFVQDNSDDRSNFDIVFQTKKVMELLGKIRAVEAVPVLVQHLTFSGQPPGIAAGPLLSIEGNRPAVAALIRIGVRSLDPVVEKVASRDEEFAAGCGATVVVGVLGPRLAPVYLKDYIEREKEPKRRARLQVMLKIAEEIGRNPKREIIK